MFTCIWTFFEMVVAIIAVVVHKEPPELVAPATMLYWGVVGWPCVAIDAIRAERRNGTL